MRLWVINPLYHLHSCITSKIFVVKPMNIPATKEEIIENFKKNNNGRPLNKDDYEIAEALSLITYKAYEVGMEDGFTAGEYIYNLSVAASKDQIDLG